MLTCDSSKEERECLEEPSSISFPSSSHLHIFEAFSSSSFLSINSLAGLELVLVLELELLHLKTASLPASTVRLVTWATSCLLGGNKIQKRFTNTKTTRRRNWRKVTFGYMFIVQCTASCQFVALRKVQCCTCTSSSCDIIIAICTH